MRGSVPCCVEYVISEAMHALGIPTTRSLAVATTGEPVYRERALKGAVLTRIASSHIRVGTMEWAAAHRDVAALTALADYTRERHYPELADAPESERHLALFEAVAERQARLIAQWQGAGFVHGVMNTDNMALSGETIDYGPCAFMDSYNPATVFSSIDVHGRYAYGNQPDIAQWNLSRLAEAMLPLLDPDSDRAVERANGALSTVEARFTHHWLATMRAKLGLFAAEPEDRQLIDDLLAWMSARHADFTNTFSALTRGGRPDPRTTSDGEFDAWHDRWRSRRARQSQPLEESTALMRVGNPAIIPRNHRVEEALAAATDGHDLSVLHRFLDRLARPYDHAGDHGDYASPASADRPYRTFCGT